MPTPLSDATQTMPMAMPVRQAASAVPPPPPKEAVRESLMIAAEMRRPASPSQSDAYSSKFAPWAKGSRQSPVVRVDVGPKAMTESAAEPPMFTVPIDDAKLETLKQTLGILAGRIKATTKDNPVAALFGAALVGEDPFVRSTRVRRTTGSSLSFGQRAIQTATKTREGGAYLVLQIETADAERIIEVRVAVQRQHPQSGRKGSFLEVIGSAPLATAADIALVDDMRQRLVTVWGRNSGRA